MAGSAAPPQAVFTRGIVPAAHPLAAGQRLRQPDLARSYRAIAAQGPEWFYRGEYPRVVEAWMRQRGGILTAADFAGYVARSRVPVPGTGILLNNEMDDFSVQPGVPNAFKLVGAEANAMW